MATTALRPPEGRRIRKHGRAITSTNLRGPSHLPALAFLPRRSESSTCPSFWAQFITRPLFGGTWYININETFLSILILCRDITQYFYFCTYRVTDPETTALHVTSVGGVVNFFVNKQWITPCRQIPRQPASQFPNTTHGRCGTRSNYYKRIAH